MSHISFTWRDTSDRREAIALNILPNGAEHQMITVSIDEASRLIRELKASRKRYETAFPDSEAVAK